MGPLRSLLAAALIAAAPSLASAERLISVGGAVTEIVYALGVGDQLVGVDTTSLFPPAVEALPKVGYMRALTAEGMLSLRPELVLASRDSGPAGALTQLSRAGVRTALIGEDLLPNSIPARIRAIGAALDRSARAEEMALAFAEDLGSVARAVARFASRPSVLFLLSANGGAVLASGRGTAADAVIGAAGGVNAMRDYEGYKPASAEAIAAVDPAFILMTTQTFDAIGGAEKVKRIPGLSMTTAGRENRVLRFESGYLLSLGPRSAHAIRDLALALAPAEAIPALPARPWSTAR